MADSSDVVPLRLTAAVATSRIHGLMRKSGVIFLTSEARQQILEMGFAYPKLVAFLAAGKVRNAPQKADDFQNAWHCCVEGIVRPTFRGAQVTLVLQTTRVIVERVRFT